MTLQHAERLSLVERVIDQLRTQITAGSWECGERIPTEPQLSDMLGVGRNTVREAVRALVHTGLLEVRQGAGTFVRSNRDPSELLESLDHAALHDQLEVRRALEVEAARLAASRRTDDDLKAISDALGARGSWTDAASLEAFVHRDAQFHLSIVRASHNAALVEMYRFFWAGLQNTIARTEAEKDLPEPTYQAHAAVYEAIVRGCPEQAAIAASELLTPALQALSSTTKSNEQTGVAIHMDHSIATWAILLAAAFLGGGLNAIAGGGSFSRSRPWFMQACRLLLRMLRGPLRCCRVTSQAPGVIGRISRLRPR